MTNTLSRFLRTTLLFGAGMQEDEKSRALAAMIDQLRPRFRARGFYYTKPYQAFQKREGRMTWSFTLGLFVHPNAFTVRPAGWIRNELIEELFHRVSCAPKTVQRDSGTIPWSWFVQKRLLRPSSFTVNRFAKLPAGVQFVDRFFLRWVEPFFKTYRSIEAIDRGLNAGNAILRAKYVPDWFEMVGRAIIAARLAARPDYNILIREYRRGLQKHTSLHSDPLAAFDALTSILAHTPPLHERGPLP